MKQRGRKSATSLEVVNHNGLSEIERPGPPAELNREEAAEWMKVVNDLPADYFRESNIPLLEGYCRTVVNSRNVASLIADWMNAESPDVEEYARLLRMQELQHRAMLSFGTKMRLTQQSTYDREKATKTSSQRKPWD